MCVRYSNAIPPAEARALFEATGSPPYYPARYNISPAQRAPIVRLRKNGERKLVLHRWGLVPGASGGTDQPYALIHARAETLAYRPVFQNALAHRRCLVPADGFFLWRGVGKTEVPFYFRMNDSRPFAFAGLWERWESQTDGDVTLSFTIIVTTASERVSPIADRMPAILPPSLYQAWLSGEAGTGVLQPYVSDDLINYVVSPRTIGGGSDDPGLVQPL